MTLPLVPLLLLSKALACHRFSLLAVACCACCFITSSQCWHFSLLHSVFLEYKYWSLVSEFMRFRQCGCAFIVQMIKNGSSEPYRLHLLCLFGHQVKLQTFRLRQVWDIENNFWRSSSWINHKLEGRKKLKAKKACSKCRLKSNWIGSVEGQVGLSRMPGIQDLSQQRFQLRSEKTGQHTPCRLRSEITVRKDVVWHVQKTSRHFQWQV